METPLLNHLSSDDYELVYEPAEDSFLLLDALEKDLPFLQTLQPSVCLEIGSGSGVVITALSKHMTNSLCLATDINPDACRITKATANHNKTSVEVIQCNLVDALRPNFIDVLIFNPPYVVTSDKEMQQRQLEDCTQLKTQSNLVYSWAGGHLGRRVIDELIDKLEGCMSLEGVLYLLLLRENKPDEVMKHLNTLGFETDLFMERRIIGEYLYILKARRKTSA